MPHANGIVDMNGDRESSFGEALLLLDEALLTATDSVRTILLDVRASVISIKEELDDISVPSMGPRPLRHVCFDCGRAQLEVFYTSKHGGYDLCPSCFEARSHKGRAQESAELPLS